MCALSLVVRRAAGQAKHAAVTWPGWPRRRQARQRSGDGKELFQRVSNRVGRLAIGLPGDPGIDLLGEFTGFEVADAFQALAGDVAVSMLRFLSQLAVGNWLRRIAGLGLVVVSGPKQCGLEVVLVAV